MEEIVINPLNPCSSLYYNRQFSLITPMFPISLTTNQHVSHYTLQDKICLTTPHLFPNFAHLTWENDSLLPFIQSNYPPNLANTLHIDHTLVHPTLTQYHLLWTKTFRTRFFLGPIVVLASKTYLRELLINHFGRKIMFLKKRTFYYYI